MLVPASLAEVLPHSAAGRTWLARLPTLVAAACARFGVVPGAPFEGGCAAWVAPVSDEAVLKVSFPDAESAGEAEALRLLAGDGAVRLLAEAPDLEAMLLERALPGTTLLGHPDPAEALAIACGVLRRVHRPVPAGAPVPRADDLVGSWARRIRACPDLPAGWRDPVADRALALLAGGGPQGLGNQDFHLGNVVAAAREPWLLIDPKPVLAPRAFDSGWLAVDVLRRAPREPGAVAAVVGRIAALLGLAPAAVAGWALVRCAVDVVWSHEDGVPPDADGLALGALLLGPGLAEAGAAAT